MADAVENEKRSKKQKTEHTESSGKVKTNVDFTAAKMPATYPYIDETLTDDYRFQRLAYEILTDCKPCECEYGFEAYEDFYFNGDWQAVWSSRHLGCDVLVLVKEKCFPDALVELVEPFCCSHPNVFADYAVDGSGQKPKTKDDVTKFLSARKHKVPLMELLPVLEQPEALLNKKETSEGADGADSKDEEYYSEEEPLNINEIAEFLELYRFFYTYMWRADFDERFGGDYGFPYTDMDHRMNIHYDVQRKQTTKAIMKSYTKTMAEYPKKAWQFNYRLREDYQNPNRDKELQKIGKQVIRLEMRLEKLTQANQKRRNTPRGYVLISELEGESHDDCCW